MTLRGAKSRRFNGDLDKASKVLLVVNGIRAKVQELLDLAQKNPGGCPFNLTGVDLSYIALQQQVGSSPVVLATFINPEGLMRVLDLTKAVGSLVGNIQGGDTLPPMDIPVLRVFLDLEVLIGDLQSLGGSNILLVAHEKLRVIKRVIRGRKVG